MKNDSKKTWNFINQLISNKNKNSTYELKIDGEVTSEPNKIAQTFNEYFSTIAANLDNSIPVSNDNPLRFLSSNHNSFSCKNALQYFFTDQYCIIMRKEENIFI